MSSQNKKKIIFGFLLLILIYIWGNNLGWFSSNNTFRQKKDRQNVEQAEATIREKLVYSQPRVNPFLIRARKSSEGSKNVAKAMINPRISTPPKPSLSFTFVGYIDQPPHSQAVLSGNDHSTIILEFGDTLVNWKLVRFTPQMAIFQFDKEFDTLLITE